MRCSRSRYVRGSRSVASLALIASLGLATTSVAQTSTVPGVIEIEATQVAAGIQWWIAGDSDQDCAVSTSFRALASPSWRGGQPLLRVEPGSFNPHNVDPGNLLAGSLFDLEPNTSYLVRLVLLDSDGGAKDTTLTFTTRAWPSVPANARVRYVMPGSGGGTGTQANPFRGIRAADAAALPGDLFLLAAGVYADSLDLHASGTPAAPIVWRSAERQGAIIDGGHLPYSLLELQGNHDLQFRGLTLRNPGSRCVLASGTRSIAVIDCRIDFSSLSGREMFGLDFREAHHENVFVSGNEIAGPLSWEDGRNDDHYGVILIGTGHVVRYNRIHGVYDAVSIGGDRDSVITSNCDVYGNELFDCTDDGVELDGSRHNIRCFDNRITNVLTGFSCQPVYGGPAYMLRNVVYNWQLKPLKFHTYPTGLIVVNNSLLGADPRGFGGGEWRRVILRNNLILGGSHANESGQPIAIDSRGLRADFDYDGWYQFDPARFARFNNVSYATLAAFRAGTALELHGRLVDYGVFVGAEEPTLGPYQGVPTFFPPYTPGEADLSLKPGATAIDAGLALANLNDGWIGSAPDLGAYEMGRPLPSYGPAADPVSALWEGAPSNAPRATIELRAFPSPATQRLSLSWSGAASTARVTIFDIAGRRLRHEVVRNRALWVWDGRDREGRVVPAGFYLARVESGERSGEASFVWLR